MFSLLPITGVLYPTFSPGLGVDDYNDQVFEKYCRDSDLFVYICHGMATLKKAVSTML